MRFFNKYWDNNILDIFELTCQSAYQVIRSQQPYRNQFKTNYKTQFLIKSYWMRKLEKKSIKKRPKKWLGQIGLTCQTHNPDHKTWITK